MSQPPSLLAAKKALVTPMEDYLDLMAELMAAPQDQVDEAKRNLAHVCGDPEPDYPDGDDG